MQDTNEARERVLDVAEKHFMDRGYTAVKLKHIADELEMKQASLYYHAPGGKEDLFVAVFERSMKRHFSGINSALQAAGDDWVEQLRHVMYWMISQPSLNYDRMFKSDMLSLNEGNAERLMQASYVSIFQPIQNIFERAIAEGKIRDLDVYMLAGTFMGLIQSIQVASTGYFNIPYGIRKMADDLLDLVVNGLRPR